MSRLSLYGVVAIGVVAAGMSVTFPAFAAEQTIQGEVVDPAGYLKDGQHGAEAADKTYEAVDGGQTLALLENGANTLYLFLAETPGEDPNELAYDHVNQQVKVTGTVYERGGARGIVPTAVVPIEAPGNPAASSNVPGDANRAQTGGTPEGDTAQQATSTAP